MRPALVLMLPAKDEAANLRSLIPRAYEVGVSRVVVCDDGSTDETAEVARSLKAAVLRHPENRGLAGALRTLLDWGVEHLKSNDKMVFMDADGTMDPMAAVHALDDPAVRLSEVAIGSRFQKGGGVVGLPRHRQLFSHLVSLFFRATHPIDGVRDYTSGFRIYEVGFLQYYRTVFPFWFSTDGFPAQTELLIRSSWLGAQIAEFPLVIEYRAKLGSSKMRVWRTMRDYFAVGMRLHLERVKLGRSQMRYYREWLVEQLTDVERR